MVTAYLCLSIGAGPEDVHDDVRSTVDRVQHSYAHESSRDFGGRPLVTGFHHQLEDLTGVVLHAARTQGLVTGCWLSYWMLLSHWVLA